MSLGLYGNVRVANPTVDDIDVYYTFSPSRDIISNNKAIKLDAKDLIIPVSDSATNAMLGGLYNIKLPTSIFSSKGIYNILIKPKEIRTRIVDCGVLTNRPDVKGIVLDTTDPTISQYISKFANNGLSGYRIEYIDAQSKNKVNNLFRIITSSNRCEPVSDNLTNTNQKVIRYKFNDIANLLFLTLTPNSTSNIKPTSSPYIGSANQEIILSNTFFDPIMLEVEMVDNTIDTLAHALYGNQTKSMEDGKVTIYTADAKMEIYKQYNLFELKDEYDKPLFEVREEVDVIDTSKEFKNIIDLG